MSNTKVELYYDGQSIFIEIPDDITEPKLIKKYIDNELKGMVSLLKYETELTETSSNLEINIDVTVEDSSTQYTLARIFGED